MKIDHKGDIGFMEAMAGAMTVCIALMAFVSFVAADLSQDASEQIDFDWSYLGVISVCDGEYAVSDTDGLVSFMEKNNLCGVEVLVRASAGAGPGEFTIGIGSETQDCGISRKLYSIDADDGRCIPTLVEVSLFS